MIRNIYSTLYHVGKPRFNQFLACTSLQSVGPSLLSYESQRKEVLNSTRLFSTSNMMNRNNEKRQNREIGVSDGSDGAIAVPLDHVEK